MLVADGDAAPAALLAGAVVPIRRAVLERLYIPGLRRAGDLGTARTAWRGELVERAGATPAEIAALARK
jgi:hypothetical protein